MVYFFMGLCILLLSYFIYIHVMVLKITKQLTYINSVQTNLIIEIPTKNRYLLRLINQVNQLIKINKTNYQHLIQTQKQFDMAISNISHDIRTPLTVASGYTQLVVKKVDNKEKQLVKKISDNLLAVEKKLESLLMYNRLVEERVEMTLEQINLSSLLETKLISYYEAFMKKPIELDVTIEKNVSLISDQDIINRLVENALGNMLNHGQVKGSVCLSQNDKTIQFSFSNEMEQPISNYDRLFERFYTEDLSRVNKNAGLGLYIIKELTTLLEGKVEVSGQENVFQLVITIPKKTASFNS